MKDLKNIDFVMMIIIVFSLLIFGCEEVIDVDLNSSEPKIVIEGSIMDDGSETFIKISKTTDYFNPGIYPTVSDAFVKISDTKGNEYMLSETEPGYYSTNKLVTEYNETYTMSVTAEGETYQASSIMEKPMTIDSAWYVNGDEYSREEDGYSVFYIFQDNPEKKDYARTKSYINGIHEFGGRSTYKDDLTNGNKVEFEHFFSDSTTQVGDTITLELLTFDKYGYNYFDVYEKIIDNDGDGVFGISAPDNPPSNISNGALGYFGAYGTSRTEIVIKD